MYFSTMAISTILQTIYPFRSLIWSLSDGFHLYKILEIKIILLKIYLIDLK